MSDQTQILQYNDKIDYLPGEQMLMVEYSTKELAKLLEQPNGAFTRQINAKNGELIAPFGSHNTLPEELDRLIWNNEDIPTILQNKVNFLMGADIIPIYKSFKDGKMVIEPCDDKKVLDWYKANKTWLVEQVESFAHNLENYGNYFCAIGFNFRGEAIYFKNYDVHNVRAIQMQAGEMEVSKYAVRQDLAVDGLSFNWETMPSARNIDFKKHGYWYMYHGRNTMPGQPYYSLPTYYGAVKKIKLHEMVTDAIIAGMKNGWNIKYKLSVHEKYYEDCDGELEKKKKKQDLVTNLNNLLSGVDKYNSVLTVDMVTDHLRGQFQDLVKIEAIDNNKESDNLYKTIEKLGQGHTRSFNVDPELSNIAVGGNLSSGAEIRNKYMVHVALKTPIPRRTLLKPLKIIGASLGFPDNLEWAFQDVEFTTLDKNPNGQQSIATNAS